MRKLFLLLALALASASPLAAQSFGVRAGVNGTTVSYDDDGNDIDIDGETNLMLGLFLQLPLVGENTITLQPELNYDNRSFATEYDVSLGNINFSRDIAYLELALLARLNLGDDEGLGFYVGAGPTLAYAVSGTTTTDLNGQRDLDFDQDRLNRGSFNFAGIAGLTFNIGGPKLFVEGRYNGSFSDQDELDDIEVRQRYFGVNGGIMVPL